MPMYENLTVYMMKNHRSEIPFRGRKPRSPEKRENGCAQEEEENREHRSNMKTFIYRRVSIFFLSTTTPCSSISNLVYTFLKSDIHAQFDIQHNIFALKSYV